MAQSDPDLRKCVLAENITTSPYTAGSDLLYVTFDFICPNCGKRHWAKEGGIRPDFVRDLSSVGFQLSCGWVSIRFPWTPDTPDRDANSVYGVGVR